MKSRRKSLEKLRAMKERRGDLDRDIGEAESTFAKELGDALISVFGEDDADAFVNDLAAAKKASGAEALRASVTALAAGRRAATATEKTPPAEADTA